MPRASKVRPPTDQVTITLPATGQPTPPAPVTEEPKPDFWEACSKVKETDWGTDYMIYVYRDDPPGRMSGYIAKLTEPIERDEFAQRFGGYKYRLMLLKGSKMIAATQHNVALPPKAVGGMADPAMLTGVPMMMGGGSDPTTLMQFAEIIKQQIEKANPADKNTIDLLMNASKSAMEIMRTQTPNPFEMFRTMMELQRQNTQPENTMVTAMVTMMGNMMSALMQRTLAPENTFQEQLKSFQSIMETFGGKFAGGGGRGPDFGTVLVGKLPEIISGAGKLLGQYATIAEHNRRAAEARARAPITVAPAPAATAAATPAVAAPAAVPATPGPVSFAPFEREPIVMPAPGAPAKVAPPAAIAASEVAEPMLDDNANIERLKQKVVQSILLGVPPETVIDYISIDNPMLFAILRNGTEAELKEMFTNDPILSQALNYPHFDQFVREAVSYIKENREPAEPVGAN